MRLEDFGEGSAAQPAGARRDAAGRAPDEAGAETLRLATALASSRSAEAEAAAAAHRAAEERADVLCATLAEALDTLRQRIDALVVDWAAAVGEAARACLPCIAASGFADEVADAAMRIARRAELPRMGMRLAPSLHDAVAGRLAGLPGTERLVLAADPDLPEGRVQLEWEDGGALIDRARLERAAQDALDRHLAPIRTKETTDERL